MAYGFEIRNSNGNTVFNSSSVPPNNLLHVEEIPSSGTSNSITVSDYNDSNSWHYLLPIPSSGSEFVEMGNFSSGDTRYGRPTESKNGNSFSFGSNTGTSGRQYGGLFMAGRFSGDLSANNGYGVYFNNANNNTILHPDYPPFVAIAQGTTTVNSNAALENTRATNQAGIPAVGNKVGGNSPDILNITESGSSTAISNVCQGNSNLGYMNRSRTYYSCSTRHDFTYDSTNFTLSDGKAVFPLVFVKAPANVKITNLTLYRPSNLSQTTISFWATTTTSGTSLYGFSNQSGSLHSKSAITTSVIGSTGHNVARNPFRNSGFCNGFSVNGNYSSSMSVMVCYPGSPPITDTDYGIQLLNDNSDIIFDSNNTYPNVISAKSQINATAYTGAIGSFNSTIINNFTNNNTFGFSIPYTNASNSWMNINAVGTGAMLAAGQGGYVSGSTGISIQMSFTDYVYHDGSTCYYKTNLVNGGYASTGGQNFTFAYLEGSKLLMEVKT